MKKLLEDTALSVLPIALLALIPSLFYGVFDACGISIGKFISSVVLVILGLSVFLLGVDVGLIPVGNQIGIKVTRKKNLPLLLLTGFILGFFITMAEPDVQVFSSQVHGIDPNIPQYSLVLAMSLGVGLFVSFALFRAAANRNFRTYMSFSIITLFLVALLVSEFFMTVSFDAGGSTTGPMTVPFIMALGLGLAGSKSDGRESSFGYIGIASIGPVLLVLILGIFFRGSVPSAGCAEEISARELIVHEMKEVGVALIPLVLIFIFMQLFVMKLPPIKLTRITIGLGYTYIGLTTLLFAVKWAFMPVARTLGRTLALSSRPLFLTLSFILGSVVVLAEPAIRVLTEQVEEASNGEVKARTMLIFLALGVAVAILLSALRVIFSLSSWLLIFPGYMIIVALMKWTPPLFIGIAFDSGGVACGPMSSTFLLPFILGSAEALGGAKAASVSFGVIALIAMVPIITVELLGIGWSRAEKKEKEGRA